MTTNWGKAAGATHDALALAEILAVEGQWMLARAECQRVILGSPDRTTANRARLLAAQAQLRMPGDVIAAADTLETLWRDEQVALETRCEAAYEWGRLQAKEAPSSASEALIFAYTHTREVDRFHETGRTLYQLLRTQRALRHAQPLIWLALQTSYPAWPPPDTRDHLTPAQRPVWKTLPARLLVGFYRRQIGPAIGMRCELEPSCSAYLLEACRAHGLLGFSLMADRLIREPAVTAAREQTVIMPDGRVRIADPLAAHDFWMKKNHD